MKKLALFSLMALVMVFTQCKKEETSVSDEGVHITLTANYGQNGEKSDWNSSTGDFVWKSGKTEYVYVGGSNHNGCIGVLTGTGDGTPTISFSGSLTVTPASGETLHFFYLGNNRSESTAASAVTSLDFSNQNVPGDVLTNYHVAIGSASYNGTGNYTATLEMKTAFAHFDLSGFSATNDVYVYGNSVYTLATINYRTGTIVGADKGNINIGHGTADTYVALIPSEITGGITLWFDNGYGDESSGNAIGSMVFESGIRAGKYYTDNGGSALHVPATSQATLWQFQDNLLLSIAMAGQDEAGTIAWFDQDVRMADGTVNGSTFGYTDIYDLWGSFTRLLLYGEEHAAGIGSIQSVDFGEEIGDQELIVTTDTKFDSGEVIGIMVYIIESIDDEEENWLMCFEGEGNDDGDVVFTLPADLARDFSSKLYIAMTCGSSSK